MAQERSNDYLKRLAPGILREQIDASGKVVWSDGMSAEQRLKNYHIVITQGPLVGRQEFVITGAPFEIKAEVRDTIRKDQLINDRSLEGSKFRLMTPNVKIKGTPVTSLTDGMLRWTGLSISDTDYSVEITVEADPAGPMAGKVAQVTKFAVLEKPLDPLEVEQGLQILVKQFEAAKLLSIGLRRNQDINRILDQLDKYISASVTVSSFPEDIKVKLEKLKEEVGARLDEKPSAIGPKPTNIPPSLKR